MSNIFCYFFLLKNVFKTKFHTFVTLMTINPFCFPCFNDFFLFLHCLNFPRGFAFFFSLLVGERGQLCFSPVSYIHERQTYVITHYYPVPDSSFELTMKQKSIQNKFVLHVVITYEGV